MNDTGWRSLRPPRRGDGEGRPAPSLVATPMMRLTRVHALGAASDAALAVALAGSIFFSISPDEARWRVALYLILTMAPFAVVTPLIGPAIDRVAGGRRAMIVAMTLARGVVAFFMIRQIETLWLFPLAFSLLVLQKGYAVAKSAVVPRFVQSETELVDGNSRLALVSAVMGVVGAVIGGGFSLIGGSGWSAAVGMCGYVAATVLATRLPAIKVATAPPAELEKAELRSANILLASSAAAVLRGSVGFITFFLAFEFRGGEESLDVSSEGAAVGGLTATAREVDITGDPAAPVWHFGVVLAAAALGAFVGARGAPRLRQRFDEDRMLIGILGGTAGMALLAALVGGLMGATLLSLGVATGAASGKLAFDSLVQRDAPDANYGRTFARYEARFQIAWVAGAFVPTVLPLGMALGSTLVAAAVGFALFSYLLGRAGRKLPTPRLNGVTDRLPSLPSLRIGRGERAGRGDEADAADGPQPVVPDPTAPLGGAVPTRGVAEDDATTALSAGSVLPVEHAAEGARPATGDDEGEDGGVPGGDDEDAPAIEPAPTWWAGPPSPVVSSVEGVQVDEPDPSGGATPTSGDAPPDSERDR